MRIGAHVLRSGLFVAPMAGVTDRPFRQLCKRLGAGLAVSRDGHVEAASCGRARKTTRRINHAGELGPISVQIAGADPPMLAEAARYNVDARRADHRHQHGLPGEEGLQRAAGSALLQDEALVARIVEAVVAARSDVPVTLKIRTGWSPSKRNALRIARIAEDAGIAMLAVHGRTRACGLRGRRRIRDHRRGEGARCASRWSPTATSTRREKAQRVLDATGADAHHDRPRRAGPAVDLPRDRALPATGERAAAAARRARSRAVLLEHLEDHYAFYGE